jgi:hypothetical protein
MPQTNILFDPYNQNTRPRGCLYIVQENENQNIYKIGMSTRNMRNRIKEYSQGTKIIYEYYVNLEGSEILKIESEIKKEFNSIFKLCKPSTERYEGCIDDIKNHFVRIIKEKTSDKDVSFHHDDLIYFPKKEGSKYQEEKLDKTVGKLKEIIDSFTEEEKEQFLKEYDEEERRKRKIEWNIQEEKLELIPNL